MALVAKRKVGVTWHDALAARAAEAGVTESCVAMFARKLDEGLPDFEAAYRTLESHGLLWKIELPGDPAEGVRTDADEVPVT